MMKYLLPLLVSIFVVACGDGGGGEPNPIVIDPGNQTLRIDRTTEYGLSIPTSGNSITIGLGNTVTFVTMAGTNNVLVTEPQVLIRSMDVSGSNNSVTLGANSRVPTLTITGTNALLMVGPNVSIDELVVLGSNAVITVPSATARIGRIDLNGSNIVLRIPFGYSGTTTIRNNGANNNIVEQ